MHIFTNTSQQDVTCPPQISSNLMSVTEILLITWIYDCRLFVWSFQTCQHADWTQEDSLSECYGLHWILYTLHQPFCLVSFTWGQVYILDRSSIFIFAYKYFQHHCKSANLEWQKSGVAMKCNVSMYTLSLGVCGCKAWILPIKSIRSMCSKHSPYRASLVVSQSCIPLRLLFNNLLSLIIVQKHNLLFTKIRYHYYGLAIKETSIYYRSVYSKKGLTR